MIDTDYNKYGGFMIARCTFHSKQNIGDIVILSYWGFKRRINILNNDGDRIGSINSKKKKNERFSKQHVFKNIELFYFLDIEKEDYYAKIISVSRIFSYVEIIANTRKNKIDDFKINNVDLLNMQKFIKMIGEGKSRQDVIKNLNISQQTVSKWFDKGIDSFNKFKLYASFMGFTEKIDTVLDINEAFSNNYSYKNKELDLMQKYYNAIKNNDSFTDAIKSCNLSDFEVEKYSFINKYLIFYLEFSKLKKEQTKENSQKTSFTNKPKPKHKKVKEHSIIVANASMKTSNFGSKQPDNSKRAKKLRNEIFK